MATAAQIAANQSNALKSTGPKSTQGKQVSKMNAVTHGIFTTLPIAKDEDEKAFIKLRNQLEDLYQPQDVVEAALVEKIMMALWRQQRARLAETAQINLAMSEEAIVKETNAILGFTFHKFIPKEEMFDDHSARYQYLLRIQNELKGLDFHRSSGYPSVIKGNAPLVYGNLPTFAKKQNLTLDKLLEHPSLTEQALEEMLKSVNTEMERIDEYFTARKTADLLKNARLIPNEKNANLIMTYEARADNAYAKAVEAFRKHRESRLKVIEGDLIE